MKRKKFNIEKFVVIPSEQFIFILIVNFSGYYVWWNGSNLTGWNEVPKLNLLNLNLTKSLNFARLKFKFYKTVKSKSPL